MVVLFIPSCVQNDNLSRVVPSLGSQTQIVSLNATWYQIGSGLGLLVSPLLLTAFGWRGTFFFWGLLGISAVIVWLFVNEGQEVHRATRIDVGAGVRSPAVWTLGLSHMGTFGLGNAIAAWIAVYLVHRYGLPPGLAAAFGSIMLFGFVAITASFLAGPAVKRETIG